MKNPEQFVRSVDILVDAYENGNLRHLSPCNCAVGNLIAYSQGTYNYDAKTGGTVGAWVALMNVIRERVLTGINKDNISQVQDSEYFRRNGRFNYREDVALQQAELTGYTANEIERIEAAFEKNRITECGIANQERNSRREDDPMDGLLKAVQVLGDIHEIPEETIHCMKEKIQSKTYTKSFDFQIPEGSKYGKSYGSGPSADIQGLVDGILDGSITIEVDNGIADNI